MRNPAVRVPPRIECSRGEGPSFFIRDVHLFDPACNLDARGGIFVTGGRIAALGPDVTTPEGVEVMDGLVGCYVFPGFLDIHTHLRSPGLEYKEDIVSAGRAAAAGGYVRITGMANTDPPVDCGPLASWVLDRAAAESSVRVAQVGGVSRGLKGVKRLVESMTSSAAGCLNVGLDGLKAGAQADFCVVDPDESWVVDRGDLQGKSRNSAFLGKQVQSRVLVTVVGGVRRLNRQKLSHA